MLSSATPDGRRSRPTRVREEGPCGNTAVTDAELNEAKRLFRQQLPTATSGLSIVQRLAVAASANITRDAGNFSTRPAGGGTGVVRTRATRNLTPSATKFFINEENGVILAGDNEFGTRDDASDNGDGERNRNAGKPQTSMSQRVVNSHLDYFRKFTPFREGRFTKDTLYQFLFFAVLEHRVRMSYAKRVLRNLLSYVRRYLEENGDGTDRVVVPIEKAAGPSVTLDIKLTPESVAFFRDNPRGMIVQSKHFFHLMNSIGNQTNNQRLKNVICEARRSRDLVFTERQNATLLDFVIRALRLFIEKYVHRTSIGTLADTFPVMHTLKASAGYALDTFVSSGLAINASPRQLDTERVVFEFCVAFLLGFLTGARIKSTIMRLTVAEIDRIIRGATIEKLTKGSFARVFIPERLTYSGVENPYDKRPTELSTDPADTLFDPRDHRSVAKLLYDVTVIRRDPLLYPAIRICKHVGRGGECGYGVYRQCRNRKRSSRRNDCNVAPSLRATLADVSDDGEDHHELTAEYRAKGGRVSVGCPYECGECEQWRRGDRVVAVEEQSFFLSGGRQLDHTFNRIFEKLFHQRRPKGVFWHSQRRRYLGAVNEKCGAVTASKSVGHADVETTMSYINKSMHREDTNRRAGSAVYEEMVRLITRGDREDENGSEGVEVKSHEVKSEKFHNSVPKKQLSFML